MGCVDLLEDWTGLTDGKLPSRLTGGGSGPLGAVSSTGRT
jgi:hypothetical protein